MIQALQDALSPPASPHPVDAAHAQTKRALEAALLRAQEAEDEATEARNCSLRMGEMALAERDRADNLARELARCVLRVGALLAALAGMMRTTTHSSASSLLGSAATPSRAQRLPSKPPGLG